MDYRRNAMRNVRVSERCGEGTSVRSCGQTGVNARRCSEAEATCAEELRSSCVCERGLEREAERNCERSLERDCERGYASDMRDSRCEMERESDCEVRVLDTNLVGAPLAMVYSPFQRFDDLFEPEEALCHGTLFRELYKPFIGSRRGV